MRLLIFGVLTGVLWAQAPDWSAASKQDISAVDRWIRDFYAGAVDPENPGFEKQWSSAVNLARERAEKVNTEAGYRFTVRALANSLRDGHVFVNFNTGATGLRSAGVGAELRGDRYYLRRLPDSDMDVPDGALLISCDGKPVSQVARERLDLFVANWEVPARRTAAVAQFFIDGGNPFVDLPKSCEYRREPSIAVLKLEWSDITAAQATAAVLPFRRIVTGRDQFTLDIRNDGAAWITVPNLRDRDRNTQLITKVRAERAKVVTAPYIVVDVRGNGGGDSTFGDLLAQAIWGDGTLKPGAPQTRPKSWRVSPAILELTKSLRDKNPAFYDRVIPRLEKGLADKRAFVPDQDPDDIAKPRPSPRKPQPVPPVFILTDGGCFSSCVLMTNLFRRMGALQAGDATDRNAIYGENGFYRELPSGNGQLSIPLAYFGLNSEELGGGPPDLPWQGPSEDQAGIEAMIRDRAAKIRSSPGTP